MSDPFIGQVIMFAGNFAPRGWALCDGALLPIAANSALFSILGTTYGGDGRTTMGLPDLRGRTPMHAGNGPGLTPRPLGQKGGSEQHMLTVANMPSHNHSVELRGEGALADTGSPANNLLAATADSSYAPADPTKEFVMHPDSIVQQNVGGSQSFGAMDPYQVVNFIIALQGTFPSRN